MGDFFSNTWTLLFLGGFTALLSVIFVAASANKKANDDNEKNQKYIKEAIDSSVNQTIDEFKKQLSIVLNTMNINADSSLSALNKQGEKIITNLQSDLNKASEGTLKNLEDLKFYSERLKLEKPIYISIKYMVNKEFLPEDLDYYIPTLTSNFLKNYISSSNYKLSIYRKIQDSYNRALVATYVNEGNELLFDQNSFSEDINNSLKLVSPDIYMGPSEQIEYTLNLKLNSDVVGDFSSLEIGDHVRLEKRVQKNMANDNWRLDMDSNETSNIFLVTSFNKKYKLKLLEKRPIGYNEFDGRIGYSLFEIIENTPPFSHL